MSFTYCTTESSSYIVPPLTYMPLRLRWDFEPSFYEGKIICPEPSGKITPFRCFIYAKYKDCPIPEIIKLFEDLIGITLIIEICERSKNETEKEKGE